jgi:hypothetical protein
MLPPGEEAVKTIPQDALLGFALTQVVALSATHGVRAPSRLWQRPFQEALIFLLAIFLPASYSFFHFWPDWSWLYLIDTEAASPVWSVLGFAGVLVIGAMGYVVAHALVIRGHRRLVYATIGLALALVAVIAVAAGDRFWRLGTFDEVMGGGGHPLYDVAPFAAHMGVVFLFIGTALLVIVLGHRRQRREGR